MRFTKFTNVPSSAGRLLTEAFVCVSLLILLGGFIAVWQIGVMRERAQRLYEAEGPVVAVLRVHSDFQRFQAELQLLSDSRDANAFSMAANDLRRAFNDDIDRAHRAIQSLPAGPDRDRQSSTLQAIRSVFSSQVDSLIDLAHTGDWKAVQARSQSRGSVISTLSEGLVRDIDELAGEQKNGELADIQNAGQRALLTLLSIGLVTMVVAGLLGWGVTRSIAGRLERLDAAARALGRGDFSHRVAVQGQDEIARLARVFNEMSTQLNALYDALSQSEAQFRSLIENAADFILVLDADGIVRYASPSFEREAGESVLQCRLVELAIPEDREALENVLATARVQRGPVAMQFRVGREPAATRTLEASVTNLLNDAAVQGIVVNARDVTERRSLEDQVSRSQKMEAIGTLSGGIAHDFNNILTVILGHTEQLLDDPRFPPSVHEQLLYIDDAARRAADLTRQLLAFSRRQVLQPKVFNLNSLIVNLDKMLRRMIREDIELRTHADPQLGSIKADRSQIEQVVMNLVLNARDAMPHGGKLTIETANVTLDEAYTRAHVGAIAGPAVMLAVSDTGEGIRPENLPHIFEPFFTTKAMGKGTGLGLSTVYGIVQQSGGHVWVYTECGRGTTFKIYLPRVSAPAEVEAERETPAVTSGDETILLVEDEPALRDLIQTVLASGGYNVLVAESAAEAVSHCHEHGDSIDLLLTDVIMPSMNGAQLAQQLQQRVPGLKVLYMSGYTSDVIVNHGVLEAGTHFLEKPFLPLTLLKRIREALDSAPV